MKNNYLSLALVAGTMIGSMNSFAQKTNETSAALEYKQGMQSMMTGDMAGANKSMLKAKTYIDLAAAHVDTKENPKTLYYKGEIYTSLIMTNSADSAYMKANAEQLLTEGLASFKKAYTTSDKFDGEIQESVGMKKGMFAMPINGWYDSGKFKEAADGYDLQVQMSDVLNQLDTANIYNAAICYERAGDFAAAAERYKTCAQNNYNTPAIYTKAAATYRKAGKKDEATKIINEGRTKFPSDRDILLNIVNSHLEDGNTLAAEQSLTEAIANDPKNKLLQYVIGTIYFELKDYDKAEAALNKAIEIDPDYSDAQYQLGAFLNELAMTTAQSASKLPYNDPNYNSMIEKSEGYYKRSIVPLEKFIVKFPNDKQVLLVLSQNYRALKNPEKSLEYKKRADAIK